MKAAGSVLALALILAGCVTEQERTAQLARTNRQDDQVCRSYMKNKSPSDNGTYEECRQGLVDMANMPVGAPQPSNVTVIINR